MKVEAKNSRGRVRKFAAWSVLLLGAALLAAAPGKSRPAAEWPKEIRIGIIPETGVLKTNDPFLLFGQYLSRQLKVPVQIEARESYLSLITSCRDQSLEVAYIGPYAYVEMAEIGRVEPLVMELDTQGRRGYQSLLIARRDSGFTKVEDGRGKVLAFCDPNSTSGFFIPMLHFVSDLGVTPASFASEVVFAGGHGLVVKGVAEGRYAIGATNDVDLPRALAELGLKPEDFRVLWTSQMIPGSLYCARRDLPASLKQALGEAMINLKDKAVLSPLKIGGLALTQDADYEIIRELKKVQREP